MVELFTAGGIIVDNVVAADGSVQLETMGGNAVYAAGGARLWIEPVGVVANVPVNYPGRWLDTLGDAGVRIDGISVVSETVARSEWFIYRADGSRIDHLHAPPGILDGLGLGATRLTPIEVAALEARLRALPADGLSYAEFRRRHPVGLDRLPASFAAARGVHLAPEQPSVQIALAQRLRSQACIVTSDPGFHALTMRDDLLGRLLGSVDAFLPSEVELHALCPDLGMRAALQRLVARGVGVAGVKLGARGACLFDGPSGAVIDMPAAKAVARDPTGAGDAFCGGFLGGLLRTGSVRAALCCATVSASFAIEAFGPFHLLATTHEDARARLAAFARDAELADAAQILCALA